MYSRQDEQEEATLTASAASGKGKVAVPPKAEVGPSTRSLDNPELPSGST